MSAQVSPLRTVDDADNAREEAAPQTVDQARIERAVRDILSALGEDPDRDGLADTPRRVAKAYRETFAGRREEI